MLHVLTGADRFSLRNRLAELLAELAAAHPNALVARVEADSFSPRALDELLKTQGLFERSATAVFDGVLAAPEGEEILRRAEECARSDNVFIFIEEKFPAAARAALKKHATTYECFEKEAAGEEETSLFPLTDAFGARDRKKLWVLFEEAKLKGVSSEEIHAMLSWQARSLFLASVSRSAAEAGMKPFPFSKAKAFAKRFSPKELAELPGKLLALYHDARRGIHDLDAALERFILTT